MAQSKAKKVYIICIIIFISALIAAGAAYKKLHKPADYYGKLIKDVYTDKSRYSPKETAAITIELNNNLKIKKGKLCIYYKYLDSIINKKNLNFDISKGKNIHVKWTVPYKDFTGYQIEVYAGSDSKLYDNKNTALDVSSDCSKFPRYGYIANYPEQDNSKSENVIKKLEKYHLNCLQFYDWQYKHQKPLAGTVQKPLDKWEDIANRDTYKKTIEYYINSCHKKNIMAANYNLMFGAYDGYEEDGIKKEWGLYKDTNHQNQDCNGLPSSWAASQIYLFNPSNKDWQNYIFNQEKDAMKVYNFDAWHIDTLGDRKELYDYNGKPVELSSAYSDFITNAKKALNKKLILNPVDGYGEEETDSNESLDFLYKEVWPDNYLSYEDLKEAIEKGNKLSKGKNIVLAAYMNYGLSQNPGKFNESGVKLTDASIFASGGAHIELGDTGMLGNEYFPNKNLQMTESLKDSMKNYYDFLVSYENLLRDGVDNCDNKIETPGIKSEINCIPNSIWTFSKKKKGFNIIHLINLLGNRSSQWVDNLGDMKKPQIKSNFQIKYYYLKKPKKIWMASPDINDGKTIKLNYAVKKDSKGQYLNINIPKLNYWDMICIED